MRRPHDHAVVSPGVLRNSAEIVAPQPAAAGPQLELRPDYPTIWQQIRRLLRSIIDARGVKVVAGELDVAPSQLLNSLDERDRHHVRASWLPWLIVNAPREQGDALLELLAGLRGLEVIAARPTTPAEELADLKDAISESLGPDLRTAILARAKTITKSRRH